MFSFPYALLSDLHCHAWSAFSTLTPEGVNSRLLGIVEEIERACDELGKVGGFHVILAGDLFHTRGALDPEVFNFVHDRIARLIERGFAFSAIPGNHDLKGKETTELGNAMQSFDELEGFDVYHSYGIAEAGNAVVMIPWMSSSKDLLGYIGQVCDELRGDFQLENCDLVIHAGIDGVLMNMPEHGLTHTQLEAFGFRRVFAGHYHNHKVFPGEKIISIGATTHQTWSDIGTKAGFLLVWPDRFEYRATHQPNFVEINGDTLEEEIPLIVDGNFVRISAMKLTDADINTMRDELTNMGAKGVLFQVTRETVSARTGTTMKTKTLSEAVGDYVCTLTLPATNNVLASCNAILSRAQEKSE